MLEIVLLFNSFNVCYVRPSTSCELLRPTDCCVLLRHAVYCYVLLRPVTFWYILLRPATSCYVISRPVTSCYVISRPATSCYVLGRPVTSCHIRLHKGILNFSVDYTFMSFLVFIWFNLGKGYIYFNHTDRIIGTTYHLESELMEGNILLKAWRLFSFFF